MKVEGDNSRCSLVFTFIDYRVLNYKFQGSLKDRENKSENSSLWIMPGDHINSVFKPFYSVLKPNF